ncbi:MAG: glutamate-1-semialdehyde 2,1-aminomutase [Deltaproteobacteria bacterium]|nr:glutamate-1-semialdehyde 2,1-aminomutase [Deltaproteobacteria bacterium]
MNRKKSIELFNKAIQILPGGVNSPVRAFRSVGGTPIFMQKGKGAKVIDVDGNEYIDYCMSWGPLILGHADDDVVRSIQDAAEHGTSFGTPHPYEIKLANMVSDAFPAIEKVRFVNSGTESTMSAIRLARGYTGKDKVIKFDGCYHGHADFLLVAAGSGLATFGTPDSAGVTSGNAKDTLVLPYNDLKGLEGCLKKEGDEVAAIIMEPVPCNNGLILPEKGYLQGVRELCDHHGIVLIFDEVINGFRLAPGGAQEYYGVKADLTTLGKIIGGGLPVGAYGGRIDIMDRISPDGPVYQAGTLSGNPIAMAAGIATLKKLADRKIYKALKEKAKLFRDELEPALKRHKERVLFSQLESIFTFSFTNQEQISSVDDVKKCDMELFASFHAEMLSQGVYLAPSGYEVGFISSAHRDKDIKKTAEAVTKALKKIL